jgi:flagellar L-ring protein precursor FlgH
MSSRITNTLVWILTILVPATLVHGQSSSLLNAGDRQEAEANPAPAELYGNDVVSVRDKPRGNPVLERYSFFAVKSPTPKKFKVGELITVIVNESKRSQNRAIQEQEKDFKLEAAIEQWVRLHDHKLIPQGFSAGIPRAKMDFGSGFEGEGRSQRDERLITRIAVKIVDVKPNGNLIIGGIKTIKEDEDERTFVLTGECRSDDVLPDNSILSTQVANVVVESDATGPNRDATRRGWIPRALDFLRPF